MGYKHWVVIGLLGIFALTATRILDDRLWRSNRNEGKRSHSVSAKESATLATYSASRNAPRQNDSWYSTFLIEGEKERSDLYVESMVSASKRLSFTIRADDPQLDTGGIGVSADPILRKASQLLFNHSNKQIRDPAIESYASHLHKKGIVSYRNVLNTKTLSILRTRLKGLESDLSQLDQEDMRWCHRYCKNMFFFAPALRAVVHAIGSFFKKDMGVEQLYLMNDEISYNVFGEPHFDGWHLDTNAWWTLPKDAWAWTIYIPLDVGSHLAGGGWLRFREKSSSIEWDEEFGPGDVLIFDRWIYHRLHDFTRERTPRLAYLLRVTNDTRATELPLSPEYHEPLAKKLRFPVGWQINYYCVPFAHPSCRPPMTGSYPSEERQYRFEIDADGAVSNTEAYLASKFDWRSKVGWHAKKRLVSALNYMGQSSLFDSMPDRRCLKPTETTAKAIRDPLKSMWESLIPAFEATTQSCSPWSAMIDAFTKQLSKIRDTTLNISEDSYGHCRNVFVELPPVLPTCVSWVHCAIDNELVSDKLNMHRNIGGFPDCLLLIPLLAQLIASGKDLQDFIALDVGANIGSCTMLMLAAGMHVAAFEPVKHNREHLIMTARQNPHLPQHKLVVLPFGLGDQSVPITMASQIGNAGNSQAVDALNMDLQSMADDAQKSMVQTNKAFFWRLEDLYPIIPNCPDTGAISLMKIDVQGFEYKVFRGAERLLKRGVVRAIVLECEGKRLALHGNVSPRDLYDLLINSGFVLLSPQHGFIDRDLNGLMLQPCASDIFGSVNLIALHSKVFNRQAQLAIQKCFSDYVLPDSEYNFLALKTSGSCLDMIRLSAAAHFDRII